jgi:hypothetical protein
MKVGLCVDDQVTIDAAVVILKQDNKLENIGSVRRSIESMYGITCESEASGNLSERDKMWNVSVGLRASDRCPSRS